MQVRNWNFFKSTFKTRLVLKNAFKMAMFELFPVGKRTPIRKSLFRIGVHCTNQRGEICTCLAMLCSWVKFLNDYTSFYLDEWHEELTSMEFFPSAISETYTSQQNGSLTEGSENHSVQYFRDVQWISEGQRLHEAERCQSQDRRLYARARLLKSIISLWQNLAQYGKFVTEILKYIQYPGPVCYKRF